MDPQEKYPSTDELIAMMDAAVPPVVTPFGTYNVGRIVALLDRPRLAQMASERMYYVCGKCGTEFRGSDDVLILARAEACCVEEEDDLVYDRPECGSVWDTEDERDECYEACERLNEEE